MSGQTHVGAGYARQLQAGFQTLRFEAPLEAEFRRSQARAVLPQLRSSLTLALVLVGVLCLLDWRFLPAELARSVTAVRLAIVAPALLAVLFATRFARPRRRALLELLAAGALAAGAAWTLWAAARHGVDVPSTETAIVLVYLYLMLGLRFGPALAVAVPLVAAAIAVRIVSAAPSAPYDVVGLLFVNLVAALICYRLEHSARRIFLEREVLNLILGRDASTGIPNRRAFDTHLHNVERQAHRDSRALGVVLIEFDCFEEYKARYGAQAAEACLKRLALSFRCAARRPLDFAARYAPARFALVLYDPTEEFIDKLAGQLRNDVALLDAPHDASTLSRVVTVSIGIGLVEPGHAGDAAPFDLAMRALETAVEEGRNRVVLRSRESGLAETRIVRGPWTSVSA
jgi:diguanylate cyclase (GGDEF)-like protein